MHSKASNELLTETIVSGDGRIGMWQLIQIKLSTTIFPQNLIVQYRYNKNWPQDREDSYNQLKKMTPI